MGFDRVPASPLPCFPVSIFVLKPKPKTKSVLVYNCSGKLTAVVVVVVVMVMAMVLMVVRVIPIVHQATATVPGKRVVRQGSQSQLSEVGGSHEGHDDVDLEQARPSSVSRGCLAALGARRTLRRLNRHGKQRYGRVGVVAEALDVGVERVNQLPSDGLPLGGHLAIPPL